VQTEFRTSKWLGLDEVHLLKNYRFVVSDVENNIANLVGLMKVEGYYHLH